MTVAEIIKYKGHTLEKKDYCWCRRRLIGERLDDKWTNFVCQKCGAKFEYRIKVSENLDDRFSFYYDGEHKEQCPSQA